MVTESDIPPDELAAFQEYAARVDGTNISAQTLLATDYLNHFNEIVMLLDMIPDMPDMVEECKLWQPKTYVEHFADSSFKDKLLAIEAYERVPSKFRRPFEETLNHLNTLILGGVAKLEEEILAGSDTGLITEHVKAISRAAQALMDCANAIIHGSDRAMAQVEIDGLIAGM
ncbi:hypothetical protein A6A04_03545 [Paramagnetospirillum marisnigri]|uniref:Uncharacterized protein n=1 Tax=Paramagnetospirillum marisnigri TaxID=1285242 RepID=A0A178MKE3_9PROT|nr:hypothetical protein [Paramagnetospirillum marisnigri]OAN49201.1 hypothetical protein A6A04_03545 [Paramagnetospirillum marisnigri]